VQNVSLGSVPVLFRDAVAAQQIIGWDKFLLGCWSVQWAQCLRAEYSRLRVLRSPERVIAEVIARLWEISWDLWLGRNAAVYPDQELSVS